METFLLVCFSFISATIANASLHIGQDIPRHSECFENYMQQIIDLNRDYERSMLACHGKDNINRRPPSQLDPQAEIEKHKQIAKVACSSLNACNAVIDLSDFFVCQSKTAEDNASEFFVMRLNASSMALELNDQFDREQKEVLRCQLIAKRESFTASSIVYKKHLNCLHAELVASKKKHLKCSRKWSKSGLMKPV